MAAGDLTPGRRRADVEFGELPEDAQPGDYWRYVVDGEPLVREHETNLTGGVWGIVTPGLEFGFGMLMLHTVREHEDGTISVRPNDGSSNSILVSTGGANPFSWHGYIERGVWREV